MEEGNLAILVDAKSEYTKQLINILKSNIYNGIRIIYQDAKSYCLENDELENTLQSFQTRLSEIPKWNQDVIENHCNTIIDISNCDWLEDLITAVFVSHTRILTSINFSKNKKKINLKIPKVENFVHKCYIDVARSFWKTPYLFDDSISKYDFQRNRRDIEHIIESCIEETIRKQLPVKHILKEYLGSDYQEEILEETESIETEIPDKYKENLRKMVQTEIENISNEKLNIETQNNTEETPNVDSESLTQDKTISEELTVEEELPVSSPPEEEEPANLTESNIVKEEMLEAPVAALEAPVAALEAPAAPVAALEAPAAALAASSAPAAPVAALEAPVAALEAPVAALEPTLNKIVKLDETPSSLSMSINENDGLNIDSLDEINLDSIIDTEMDKLNKNEVTTPIVLNNNTSNDLEIEDLNDLDLDLENIDSNNNYAESEKNVKTIVLDTNSNQPSAKPETKKDLLKGYIRKKDFSFFDE